MKKLPYFPFYYLDWLSSSSVSMMTHEEKGLFIDMLSRCYNDDGLPDNNDKLQRLFNCSEELIVAVKDMFYSVDGLLKNEKLDSIIKDQQGMIKDKSRAGKASAKARAAKRLHISTAVEHVLDSVPTEAQQNPTNRTEHNRTEHNNNNSLSWLETAKTEYLDFCEKYFNMLKDSGKVKKNMNWKTKAWYDAARLLVERDGESLDRMTRVLNYVNKNIDDQYFPQAWSVPSLREKWMNIKSHFERNSQTKTEEGRSNA